MEDQQEPEPGFRINDYGQRVPNNDRSQIAKIAARTRWANTEDRSAATQAARDGLMRKFEDQVDPDRRLAPEERAKRAESARLAHYQRMALRSAQARRRKAGGVS